MIRLNGDNRVLTLNAKYSYLVDNYASGTSTIYVTNTEGFSTGAFILIGEFGQETAEIFRCGTVTTSTGAIALLDSSGSGDTTTYAHSESTKVYVIPYNQIRFYWTAAAGDITDEDPSFSTGTPLTGWTDLEPASWYTTYDDSAHSTGFGWFIYQNSVSAEASQESNPIPYAGFAYNTVANIFEDFDSLLNVNELKLVSMSDKFSWLNEGVALVKNKLNLTNAEYTVSAERTITLVVGTQEYQLDADFSDLVYLHDGTTSKVPIPFMKISEAMSYTGGVTHYYIRGRYVGIVPTPSASATYKYRYRANATRVTSLSTYIDLPDNGFYALKDFMMFRACLKFNNQLADTYYQSFVNNVNLYIQASVKRDSNLDEWGIASHANT